MAETLVTRHVTQGVSVPIGASCRLCKLDADDIQSAQIEVRYGGDKYMPENPLCALNRRSWICGPCLLEFVAAVRHDDPAR